MLVRVVVIVFLIFCSPTSRLNADEADSSRWSSGNLPNALTHEEFSALIREMSEPDGEFHSSNYISNESSYLHVVDVLRELRISGGVYVGVGPEQNFSYIGVIKPAMAFIVDIRRQNLLLHLVYKALFELSDSRADFISNLLSKPLYKDLPVLTRMFRTEPAWLSSNTQPTLGELIRYFDSLNPDLALYNHNLQKVKVLVKNYGVTSSNDLDDVTSIFHAFFKRQLDIQYDLITPVSETTRSYPTLRDLLLSVTEKGEMAGFLADERTFNFVKEMQKRNLIIPVVGDFGGEKALRSIASYVKYNKALISAFYTSNVEMYLSLSYPLNVEHQYRDGYKLFRFADNIAVLPTDASSVFIRAYHNDHFDQMLSHPERIDDHVFTTIVQSMKHFLDDGSWRSMPGYDRYIHIVTNGVLE